MARLVTKFKYLKPNARESVGGYAKYIATREGVKKIDESYLLSPASQKQEQLIEKILSDFPDTKEMLEYEDYQNEQTKGNASEFITRALEDNAHEVMQSKTYADYIATRPRAERFGSHGLFTDDGKTVKLGEVSDELNHYEGNVWTVIISLRREDAERLGYNQGERWRDMLRTQTAALSENFKIPMESLKWYAAFHNESHHPHVHLMVYAEDGIKPYLSKKGVMKLRSSFAKDIFAQDLLCVYEKQTEHRDALKIQSREVVQEMITKIHAGVYDNPILENLLLTLADRLSKTSGKKQYGYLKSDVKAIINSIVFELSADERIKTLYDLWYEQKEKVLRTYTEELPMRIPLVDNPEFKSIKNAVIAEAMNIVTEHFIPEEAGDDLSVDEELTEDDADAESKVLSAKEKTSLMWQKYREAKELLDRDSEKYNPREAVHLLIESAELGCGVAKYRLGKLFYMGEYVPKNIPYALRWLEESAEERNPYSEYLLGKIYLRGEDVDQDLEKAENLLNRSSDGHNRFAKYLLAKSMLNGIFAFDVPKAVTLLTESADSGFAVASYMLGKMYYTGELIPKDMESALKYSEQAAMQKNPYAAYLAGKIRLTEDAVKDIPKAIRNFEIAAENGNDYAEYMLGRIYLYGKYAERDYDKAMLYLTSSAEHGNQYAEQLLHSIKSNKNWSAATGSIRLLHHLSRMLQNRLEDERKGRSSAIDRKLKRMIDEKKQANGLKQG